MKKIEKILGYITELALFIDLGIIAFMYVTMDAPYILGYNLTESIYWVGIISFFYSVIYTVIYILKIIASHIFRKEKYIKEEKRKDIKKVLLTLIGVSFIFGLLYLQVKLSYNDDTPLGKPVIYLYPETQMNVTVKLNNVQNLIHTYPKYIDGWNVIANPNGNIVDINTGRNLYCLYWEGKDNTKIDMTEGFVVEGKDTISFLEEKLSIIGLNEREANEFIIYWLPKMENNKYNYIRFRTSDEISSYMKLDITPKPDSIIRVVMDFKPLNKYIFVKEQKFNTPLRTGFTVVEWGARELK